MKQLLAIDTTTEACSVALSIHQDGKQQLSSRYQLAPRRHAELILSMVDELLLEAKLSLKQLDAIVVTVGPGAFTGVRLGVAVAQGLAFSTDLNIIPVNTLQTLAIGTAKSVAFADCKIAVAMDARMNEVYWGCFSYKQEKLTALTPQIVVAAMDAPLAEIQISEQWLFAGTGWQAYPKAFSELFGKAPICNEHLQFPRAENALLLAQQNVEHALTAELISPIYLRDKVAETIIERQAKGK